MHGYKKNENGKCINVSDLLKNCENHRADLKGYILCEKGYYNYLG